jgi:AcrR family transcriptional regulator
MRRDFRHRPVTIVARQVAPAARNLQDVAVGDSGDWRSRKWEATHRRIFDTAMRLFEEHGFERVNISQLAAAAEVSVPTFYAHFPSKEHVVMQLPTAEQLAALLATQPAHLPVADRLRSFVPLFFAQFTPQDWEDTLARWKVIAATPGLRTRAAEFERTTADMLAGALPAEPGLSLTPSEAVVVNAYMAAFTTGLLAWADSDGQEDVEKLVDEAIAALQQGSGK